MMLYINKLNAIIETSSKTPDHVSVLARSNRFFFLSPLNPGIAYLFSGMSESLDWQFINTLRFIFINWFKT